MRKNLNPIHRLLRRLALAACVAAACLGAATLASGQDLQTKLNDKKAKLDQSKEQEGVLSTTIERAGNRLDQLRGEVATLRNREAIVATALRQKEAQLKADRDRLVILRAHLDRSIKALSARLIEIYKSDQPDALTVILNANGFDDLLTRYDYLNRIQHRDGAVVDRVRSLRDEQRTTVERVTRERNEIAARKEELARTRAQLESRQNALDAAQARRENLLGAIKHHEKKLEGDVSEISDQIAAQVAAAQSSSGVPTAPAGPFRGISSEGFIWPVNGPVTSPFCEVRAWESCHPGIDIGVASGTPIKASANGRVILVQPEASSGGYGNFTCVDHGGGISTCYAHQQQFLVSQGEDVKQGQTIGISDCTGLCFGPHLHFEVRINGQVTDPMAYLP